MGFTIEDRHFSLQTSTTLKLLHLAKKESHRLAAHSNELRHLQLLFSERERPFTFAICHRPSVCRLSVTLVHPTKAIEIFGNISAPCGTLAIHDLCIKILRRSSDGNPSVGGVEHNRGIRI